MSIGICFRVRYSLPWQDSGLSESAAVYAFFHIFIVLKQTCCNFSLNVCTQCSLQQVFGPCFGTEEAFHILFSVYLVTRPTFLLKGAGCSHQNIPSLLPTGRNLQKISTKDKCIVTVLGHSSAGSLPDSTCQQ
ncbi:hypothetical protein ATANTOWER_023145 [Ataeniobius toweri]|uniref:Uncharacterized protein n=1 Tax=Ataeniobius toweri TaxID=208326 RepID=A0ABU7CKK0_9TELE|nr:hypothetical protein [Ataeniobius toweri]